jgi:hypothetical protein
MGSDFVSLLFGPRCIFFSIRESRPFGSFSAATHSIVQTWTFPNSFFHHIPVMSVPSYQFPSLSSTEEDLKEIETTEEQKEIETPVIVADVYKIDGPRIYKETLEIVRRNLRTTHRRTNPDPPSSPPRYWPWVTDDLKPSQLESDHDQCPDPRYLLLL